MSASYHMLPNGVRKLQFKALPKSSPLYSESAVDPFMSLLFSTNLDPDEVLKVAGVQRSGLRKLTGDDEITAAMDTRREAILSMPWRIEPAGQDGDPETLPEPVLWLWNQFEPRAEQILRACMQALPYGYSVMEVTYRNDEQGRVTWNRTIEKPFEWFIPLLGPTADEPSEYAEAPNKTRVLFVSSRNPRGELMSPFKFFLTVRNQEYRNPFGEALFSRLYWPWFFRTNGWRFWVKWLERFGTPLLIGHTAGDSKAVAEALSLAVQNAAIAVGHNDKVEVAEQASGSGHFEGFDRAICARIQRLILGQTLTSDSGGSSGRSGSYALGQIHNEVRKDRRDADVRLVTGTVQAMLNTLWHLNGFDMKQVPRFVLQDDSGLETDRAERDSKLAQAGIVQFTADYLLRVYDFEPEDIVIPDHTPVDTDPPAPGDRSTDDDEDADPTANRAPRGVRFVAGRFSPKQQVIEDRLAAILAGIPQPLDERLLQEAIRTASSPEDLHDKLAALLAGAEPGAFNALLERCLFAADILGYVHAGAPVPPTEE